MDSTLQRTAVIAAIVIVFVGGACFAVTRPAPRQATPLLLDDPGIDGETVVRDRRGRPIIANVRTVEKGVLYRGSGFPTSFPSNSGEKEYADQTAFEFLRSRNVRHVVALMDDEAAYYAEDGYLKFWSEKTGFAIGTTWVRIDQAGAYAKDDRGGLHAAGILISLMRERVAGAGAVYVHDLDGVSHAGIAVAGYELWRNRGWNDYDSLWTLAERRFLGGNRTMQDWQRAGKAPAQAACPNGSRAFVCRESLRSLREELRFVIEL
ncbi:MAG: hypothetical protein M3R55_10450 [Acidobacteriota bacterium]|nr:hypothetical protein [Acidobacteriota bacterium]